MKKIWQLTLTDPNIRAAMQEQLISSALRREAIAPKWEVNTARMQQDAGDPLAGLTEAECAARSGLGATYDATSKKPIGQFRAVTLDLDGNGTITTAGKDEATNTVAFDWDDSGFNKQVAWVKPNDGFLFLDRDSNGVVSSAKELFSNSLVSDDYKGTKSIEWVDANRDGKVNSLDPVFANLKVWQDINADGDSFNIVATPAVPAVAMIPANGSTPAVPGTPAIPAGTKVVNDEDELKSLADLGITELDYINGRFTRNGVLYAMKSDTQQSNTTKTIALCAKDTPARCLDDAENAEKSCLITTDQIWVNEDTNAVEQQAGYYEFDSTSRRFYAGGVSQRLVKLAQNDDYWRCVA